MSREEARWAQLQAARAGASPAQLAGAFQRAVDTQRSQAQVWHQLVGVHRICGALDTEYSKGVTEHVWHDQAQVRLCWIR